MGSAMGSINSATALHLAKQGNPRAIAALMNGTLQPRGISVTAETQGGNLHILLIARRPVPQGTLIEFIRRGLRTLELELFPRVRVSAYLCGEDLPLWIEESPWPGLTPEPERKSEVSEAGVQPRGRSRLWLLLGLLACLGGGAGGLMAWFVREGGLAPNPGTTVPTLPSVAGVAPASPPDRSPLASPQHLQAQAYLAKIGQAQRAFYVQNSRFAASLEELERSASVIVRPGSYRYTLTVRQSEQSDLTAVPQDDGLVSFRAIAVLPEPVADVGQPQRPLVAICVSAMATKNPPELPTVQSRRLQCPPNSFSVPVPEGMK